MLNRSKGSEILLMGIDVGTTSFKAEVFNVKGEVIASGKTDYTLLTEGEIVEFEPEEYWRILEKLIADLSRGLSIAAFAIDSQGETLILTDETGKPLRNAIVWLDNRAVDEAEEISGLFGEEYIYKKTGQPEVLPTWPACKLLWVKKNQPDIWAKTKKIMLLEDYLIYKLTGEFATDLTLQSSTLYFDINTGNWWDEMLDIIGISKEQLPMLYNSGELIGYSGKTAVVAGALDQIAGAIGAGVIKPGIISEMTGTAMAVCMVTEKPPKFNEKLKIPCHYHAVSGLYCLIIWSPIAGMALKWFKDNLSESYSFNQMHEIAEKVPAGSEGLIMLPHLCGQSLPDSNPNARGVFFGFTLKHTRAHFIRSILEAVAFMLKSDLDCIDAPIEQIRALGGGAVSELWCQIKADVTKKEIVPLKNSEAACLGSAILAGVGIGVFKSIEEACEKLVKTNKSYIPGGDDYAEVYEKYKMLNDRLLNWEGGLWQ